MGSAAEQGVAPGVTNQLADVPIKKLILVPSAITLAVTLLRVAGQLMDWPPGLFNRTAGGSGTIVDIGWLVPIFGIYFGLKLANAGQGPSGVGSALVYSVLGLALMPGLGLGALQLRLPGEVFRAFAAFVVPSALGAVVASRAWPVLGRTLLAYGLAARIPAVIAMFFAILFPEMSAIERCSFIGVVTQLTIWIWFTIAAGVFFGAIAVAATSLVRRLGAV
jgi:hypothetical protein